MPYPVQCTECKNKTARSDELGSCRKCGGKLRRIPDHYARRADKVFRELQCATVQIQKSCSNEMLD